MRRFALITLLTATLAACGEEEEPATASVNVPEGAPDYTLYLVRHAEKTDDSEDPGLSSAGITRAARLAGWFAQHPVEAVWSSSFRRTMQTAAPVQANLGVPMERYDPADLPGLAERLKAAGVDALVVGHSNTTPELAGLLCGCEVISMDETQYDLLFVVEMRDGAGHLAVMQQE